jgi:hypothetical protein
MKITKEQLAAALKYLRELFSYFLHEYIFNEFEKFYIYFLRVKVVRVFLIWLGKHLVVFIKKWQAMHFLFFHSIYNSWFFEQYIGVETWMIRLVFILWDINAVIFFIILFSIIFSIYYTLYKLMKYYILEFIESFTTLKNSLLILIKFYIKKINKKLKEKYIKVKEYFKQKK